MGEPAPDNKRRLRRVQCLQCGGPVVPDFATCPTCSAPIAPRGERRSLLRRSDMTPWRRVAFMGAGAAGGALLALALTRVGVL